MIRKILIYCGVALILSLCMSAGALAQPPLTKCAIHPQPPTKCSKQRSSSTPRCGIEMTCTDKPIQLGYSDGVCFRAGCPGIWALVHKRVDQASFRFRVWTYRHYSFKGYWQLKDQGAVQSGPVEIRELFLVLPDDLIEFRLQDPDKYARVELRNVGYIKRGNLCELKKWLAKQSYLEGPALIEVARDRARDACRPRSPACNQGALWPFGLGCDFISGVGSVCRKIGLPF